MAKVFTIAPGLDNLGAMKTGGQGSVYKGRRIGEIITAIKLLPTPIHSESEHDKSYRDFVNEVEKLKRVNREPNPNVVKILSSGLSETGNFPFIEMDFIEGPDLEELLKPPHEPLFKLSEVVKVAIHLSNALAHCHRNEIKHGDIKSNNVKYNIHTGNYVLLDFGLAVMTDEDRRTSLRQAGAIEFMAPEQNEGKLLSQTDIYGFGVIMFELLAGQVPFPLQDKGESARNLTRLQHMEAPLPDLVALRRKNMPGGWSAEMQAKEMVVPGWMLQMVYKCLEKQPEKRFANGIDLYDYVCHASTHASNAGSAVIGGQGSDRLLQQLKQQVAVKDQEIARLQQSLQTREPLSEDSRQTSSAYQEKQGVSRSIFLVVLLIAIGLAGYTAYSFITQRSSAANSSMVDSTAGVHADSTLAGIRVVDTLRVQRPPARKVTVDSSALIATTDNSSTPADQTGPTTDQPNDPGSEGNTQPEAPVNNPVRYKVAVDKAYFYSGPDESSKRRAYMVPSDNALLTPVGEENGFIYIIFTNQYGQTSKGWLKKNDLKVVSD